MATDEAARRSRAIKLHRRVLGFTRHWLKGVIIFFGVYVGLPLLAPALMYVGATGPAEAIYAIYAPLCHQFAFRSWFLFGEQPVYPRADAGIAGLTPFEVYARQEPHFARLADPAAWTADLQVLAATFHGNPRMGYKIPLCQRCLATHGALFLAALAFAPAYVRSRLRPPPLWLYALLGLGPIGLDGLSQLLSAPPFGLWPIRESTPLFRTLTGGLFGLMNAWLALPYLEESMREARREVEAKLRRAGALPPVPPRPTPAARR